MTEVKGIDRSVVEYELELVIHWFILIDLYDFNQVKITSITYQCRKLVADLTNGILGITRIITYDTDIYQR